MKLLHTDPSKPFLIEVLTTILNGQNWTLQNKYLETTVWINVHR